MLSKLQTALAALLAPGEELLIGVSGGADSVALLDALVKLGWRPHVCHLNHQHRGADSDADAEFVRQLAGKYGLPATIEVMSNVNVGATSRSRPDPRDRDAAPTEETWRRARFDFFASVAAQTGIHKLALAHTADDQVETFLMRLLRGAGVPGLAGIWPERQFGSLRVIRPLLDVSRSEVLEYLRVNGLAWREDASNADPRFLRNRIRHELLPLLERDYNPAIREVLRRTVEILRAEARGEPVADQRRALREWLGDELGFDHIEAVRQLPVGGEVTLPGGVAIRREHDGLHVAGAPEPVTNHWPLNLAGATELPELGLRLHCEIVGQAARLPLLEIGKRAACPTDESLDADALGAAPLVRTWQEGDRFQPLGMSQEKKLQDFFVDEKIPRRHRGRTPLLIAADGRIAWVVGCRIAEPFKVTEHSKRVLRITAATIQS